MQQQRSQSVMNSLHSIGDQIAESTRQRGKNAAESESAPAAPAEHTAPQAVPASIPAEDAVPAATLKRRYDDFIRMRNDLVDRLNNMSGLLNSEEIRCVNRLNTIREAAGELERILSELPEQKPGQETFSNRTELAEITLAMERLRIETLRLTPVVESGADEVARSAGGIKKHGINGTTEAETGVLLESLSFRQIFRTAFIASLPILIGLTVSAILIAIAMIGSFKGIF